MTTDRVEGDLGTALVSVGPEPARPMVGVRDVDAGGRSTTIARDGVARALLSVSTRGWTGRVRATVPVRVTGARATVGVRVAGVRMTVGVRVAGVRMTVGVRVGEWAGLAGIKPRVGARAAGVGLTVVVRRGTLRCTGTGR